MFTEKRFWTMFLLFLVVLTTIKFHTHTIFQKIYDQRFISISIL